MTEKKKSECIDEKDILHHLMEEQIAYICVKEEEEQIQKDLANSHSQTDRQGY